MILSTENILLVGSILLLLSIVAGKTSFRFGFPVLILFLAIGMIAGSEGIGGIYFNDPGIAQFIGIIALNFILFSGGLETNWTSIKPVLWQGITLSTLGVFLTTLILGVFTWLVTDFTIYEGLLLGAIVSSTDAAAVFAILRTRKKGLKHNLRPMLELESGSNDPMAYFLTIAFTGLVANQGNGIVSILPVFLKQIIIGTILGYLIGRAGKYMINKIQIDFEGLYPVLVIGIMFFSFSATDFLGGNGFLSVYLSAVYLGNQDLIHKKKILKSFDGFAWLMQIVLFLTLGLLVFPSEIVPVMGIGLLISVFLILVARPLSVFISTSFFKIQNRCRIFVSWVGLRGAVPIVFATFPLLEGLDKAQMIFNIVFFISVTSVIIQGTSLSFVARILHLSVPEKVKHRSVSDMELTDGIKSKLNRIYLPETAPVVGLKIVDLGFPKTSLISLIERDSKYISPEGSTILEGGDILLVVSENQDAVLKVYECLGISLQKQ